MVVVRQVADSERLLVVVVVMVVIQHLGVRAVGLLLMVSGEPLLQTVEAEAVVVEPTQRIIQVLAEVRAALSTQLFHHQVRHMLMQLEQQERPVPQELLVLPEVSVDQVSSSSKNITGINNVNS